MSFVRVSFPLFLSLLIVACDDDKAAVKVDSTGAFPLGLALASPFSQADATPANALSVPASQYDWSTQVIEDALSGTAAPTIKPERFMTSGINADCYGPSMMYENHPDGVPADGTLPGGDVGIWTETDTEGNACVVAQLNARMQGMEAQFHEALVVAATLIGVADAAGVLPAAGTTSDVTAELAAAWTAVTVSSATLSQGTDGTWSYAVSFVYTTTKAYSTTVRLSHTPGASSEQYSGTLSFQTDGDSADFGGGNCPDADRTLNGSLKYSRTASTAMATQARTGTFCGAGADGRAADGTLDATLGYDATSAPNGWSENFSIFTSDFNPETLGGDYAYAWQAGVGDSNTRVLNVGVNDFDDGTLDGEGYFGFSDRVQDDADGSIGVQGFICSWAGPEADHTFADYAQRQFFEYDEASGLWELPSAAASNITYAPTNSCTYDGSGTFLYDRDHDNDLSDESAVTATVTTPDLMTIGMGCASGTPVTVWESIECRGYNLPAAP